MRFLCCCCCRRSSVDERNDAEAVENARAADSDTDSFRQDSLDKFRFPESDHAKAGRSPSELLPGARTSNTAAGNKGDYFVACYGPSPEKDKDRGEWVPLVMGSPDSSDSPPIVTRTVAASTAAAPVGAKTGTAPPPPPPPVSASESLPLSLKKTTTTTKKTATSEVSSASDANAKLASIAAAAASVAAAKSAARSATSVPQGNAKATAGAAAAPKANAKATTSTAAASTNNGATAATLVPKGNAKATRGVAASATLPKTTAAPPKAAVSASAASVPQKNKVSPTEGAASKITKIPTVDEAVCASLLTLINQLRISKDIKPLRLCNRLRPVALSAWKARKAAKDGLAVVPKCQTALKLKTGDVALFDCLSYLDIPLHSKEGLPAAAMHFWEHAGRYKTNSGQRPLKSESAFPAAGSAARRDLDACKEAFEALLLASRNTRVCLRLARTSRATEDESEPDRQPLAVVAVFAPEDAKP